MVVLPMGHSGKDPEGSACDLLESPGRWQRKANTRAVCLAEDMKGQGETGLWTPLFSHQICVYPFQTLFRVRSSHPMLGQCNNSKPLWCPRCTLFTGKSQHVHPRAQADSRSHQRQNTNYLNQSQSLRVTLPGDQGAYPVHIGEMQPLKLQLTAGTKSAVLNAFCQKISWEVSQGNGAFNCCGFWCFPQSISYYYFNNWRGNPVNHKLHGARVDSCDITAVDGSAQARWDSR